LKNKSLKKFKAMQVVSNPWREAIEGILTKALKMSQEVSNPWREAIEVFKNYGSHIDCLGFQSLEGGY